MTRTEVLSLLIGKLSPLGERGLPSGIAKTPVDRPIRIGPDGFDGDAQGDTTRHGGPEKAIHHYPFEHYSAWAVSLGNHPLLSVPGAFGENIATRNLTESDVAIGDTFRLGSAMVQVSQGRQPCWKLNDRFGNKTVAKQVQETGKTGWYYRVLETGVVVPGDTLDLIDRPFPDWTINRIWRTFYVDLLNRGELEGITKLELLARSWRDHAWRRLESGRVENWDRRLNG